MDSKTMLKTLSTVANDLDKVIEILDKVGPKAPDAMKASLRSVVKISEASLRDITKIGDEIYKSIQTPQFAQNIGEKTLEVIAKKAEELSEKEKDLQEFEKHLVEKALAIA